MPCMQSTLTKPHTVGSGSICPSYRGFCLIEIFGYSEMMTKKAKQQGQTPGVRLVEVSVKRELTVFAWFLLTK